MDQIAPEVPKKSRVWIWIIIAIAIILVALIILRADEDTWIKDKTGQWIKHGNPSSEAPESSEQVSISDKVLQNKFGFLGGGPEDAGEAITDSGAAWARPHPGGIVWDMMQKKSGGEISYEVEDKIVKNLQKNNIGILGTIWPFADFDQKTLANANSCKVSEEDEFLPTNDKKGRGSYLPQYRCNPNDWAAYQKWVEGVVERYDGDGIKDMPNLKMPIKYWEVMNEPDLQYQNNAPAGESDRLNFYKQGPAEYGELLKKTYTAIKAADPDAKVLIAGAAGGDEQHLGFYDEMFAKTANASNYFDIGNIHCISNDQQTSDFNVAPYKSLLAKYKITQKPIWVTEAEAMYGKTGDENFASTKKSTEGAISAGAQRIFYTRYEFDDTRTDMSKQSSGGSYPSLEKYKELFSAFVTQ